MPSSLIVKKLFEHINGVNSSLQNLAFKAFSLQYIISSHKLVLILYFSFLVGSHKGRNIKFEGNFISFTFVDGICIKLEVISFFKLNC